MVKKLRIKLHEVLMRLYRAAYKLWLGRDYGHMAKTTPYLKLLPKGQQWDLYWKGAFVGVTGNWQELRDIAPTRLFSIGSGPSVAQQQFSMVKGEECVLVNGAASLVTTGVLPDCFAVMVEDARFIHERSDLLMSLPRGTRLCLVASAMQALGVAQGLKGGSSLFWMGRGRGGVSREGTFVG